MNNKISTLKEKINKILFEKDVNYVFFDNYNIDNKFLISETYSLIELTQILHLLNNDTYISKLKNSKGTLFMKIYFRAIKKHKSVNVYIYDYSSIKKHYGNINTEIFKRYFNPKMIESYFESNNDPYQLYDDIFKDFKSI
jgi:hypothetical protein